MSSSLSKFGIGQGDCDWDSDCLDGLDCPGWVPDWADDCCEAGNCILSFSPTLSC